MLFRSLDASAPQELPTVEIIDFEKVSNKIKINDLVTLYVTPNKVNDLFNLSVVYETGSMTEPMTAILEDYLSTLGTETTEYKELCRKLQNIGTTMNFKSSAQTFTISMVGLDKYFSESMDILGDFISNVKADKKAFSQSISNAKMLEKTRNKDADIIAKAMLERVEKGKNSSYLAEVTSKDLKKMKPQQPLAAFKKVTETECTIHYSGTLSANQVLTQVEQAVNAGNIVNKGNIPAYFVSETYDKPKVYFYDMPKSRQAIIFGYTPTENIIKDEDKVKGDIFNFYFGGDMTSLMFQEVREFRSLAYRSYSRLRFAPYKNENKASLITGLSTQTDKAI